MKNSEIQSNYVGFFFEIGTFEDIFEFNVNVNHWHDQSNPKTCSTLGSGWLWQDSVRILGGLWEDSETNQGGLWDNFGKNNANKNADYGWPMPRQRNPKPTSKSQQPHSVNGRINIGQSDVSTFSWAKSVSFWPVRTNTYISFSRVLLPIIFRYSHLWYARIEKYTLMHSKLLIVNCLIKNIFT